MAKKSCKKFVVKVFCCTFATESITNVYEQYSIYSMVVAFLKIESVVSSGAVWI